MAAGEIRGGVEREETAGAAGRRKGPRPARTLAPTTPGLRGPGMDARPESEGAAEGPLQRKQGKIAATERATNKPRLPPPGTKRSFRGRQPRPLSRVLVGSYACDCASLRGKVVPTC